MDKEMRHDIRKEQIKTPVFFLFPDGSVCRIKSSTTIFLDHNDKSKGNLIDGRFVILHNNEWVVKPL